MAQTLADLKAENEEKKPTENAEEIENDNASQAESDATGTETEGEPDPKPEDGESNGKKDGESDVDSWMQDGEGHNSQADKKYTGTDIGAAKAKLRAKLEKRHDSETEKLNARIAELESKVPPTGNLTKPKRDDFVDSDDPDEAYFEALTDWKSERNKHEQAAQAATIETQRVQQGNALKVAQGVDAHYERAAELVAQSGIKPEAYQAADMSLRSSVDELHPGQGDVIVDALLAMLGKGSEKVAYNLGVNKARKAMFIEKMREDPNGFSAFGYLKDLAHELDAPKKRTTRAPEPSAEMKGDAVENASEKQLHKKYVAAHKSGNQQEALNIRRKAKAAGVSVSTINDW